MVGASSCASDDERRHAPSRVSAKSFAEKVRVRARFRTKASTCGRTGSITSAASFDRLASSAWKSARPGSNPREISAIRVSTSAACTGNLKSHLADLPHCAAPTLAAIDACRKYANDPERDPAGQTSSARQPTHPSRLRPLWLRRSARRRCDRRDRAMRDRRAYCSAACEAERIEHGQLAFDLRFKNLARDREPVFGHRQSALARGGAGHHLSRRSKPSRSSRRDRVE